jgi:putative oxygen-independent coproporphyrinogen III oxidase
VLPPPRALYLHVPFCPKVCPYCDFHKMRRHEGLVTAYLKRLREEARALYAAFPGPLDTLYFGGGTPSHLTDDELAFVTRTLEATWGFPAALETTLEADPKTFDRERLETFRALGFNRLSIGVQSTQDAVLAFLGRQHTGREGLAAVEMALAAGFMVSADLITAVPGQDAAADLHALAQTGVAHVSVYTLTVEPYTPFARRGVTVDEDKEAEDYALAEEVLGAYGLVRYEVSSHARPGCEAKHNSVYWRGDPFLALGPAAAAFVPVKQGGLLGERRTNPPIKAWLAGTLPEVLPVGSAEYVQDVLMTGLRTVRGVDLAALSARAGFDVAAHYQGVLERLERSGLLERSGALLRATEAGLLQLNGVTRALFDVAPPPLPPQP